jgi:hypothetical protein
MYNALVITFCRDVKVNSFFRVISTEKTVLFKNTDNGDSKKFDSAAAARQHN